jgi:uncharacterized protein (DUF427 family)
MEIAANGKPVESVWDFPRPPRLERVEWRVRVIHRRVTIVDAPHALRVLETSQAPAYYVAAEFVALEHLVASSRRSMCEWKGVAEFADVVVGNTGAVSEAAWTYRSPTRSFSALAGHWAFYAQKLDECWIDDERVIGNEGGFYGGWVTANVTGPFKGAPGTAHW